MISPASELGSREGSKLSPRIGLLGDWVIGAANTGPGSFAATATGTADTPMTCVPM